jgi:hypothetical protein
MLLRRFAPIGCAVLLAAGTLARGAAGQGAAALRDTAITSTGCHRPGRAGEAAGSIELYRHGCP